MAEDLHRHRAVEQHPAAQEHQERAVGRVGALFSASSVTFLKLLGVGMIVALVVDATVVRILLVPATMRLLGRANWWAPGPLRRLYSRYGISETAADQSTPARSKPRSSRTSPCSTPPASRGLGATRALGSKPDSFGITENEKCRARLRSIAVNDNNLQELAQIMKLTHFSL